jgi:hypothetical protein
MQECNFSFGVSEFHAPAWKRRVSQNARQTVQITASGPQGKQPLISGRMQVREVGKLYPDLR